MTIIKSKHSLHSSSTTSLSPDIHWKPRHIVPITDFCAIGFSLLLGITLSNRYAQYNAPNLTDKTHLLGLTALAVLWMLGIWYQKGYTLDACLRSNIGIKMALKSTFYVAGGLAIVDAFFGLPLVNPYLAISFPSGFLLIAASRAITALIIRRVKRARPSRLLFVGQSDDILDVVGNNFESRFPFHEVAAVSLTDPENQHKLRKIENCEVVTYTSNMDVAQIAKRFRCDAVWVASVSNFGHKNLRRLAWHLRNAKAKLYLEPMLEGVAENRLSATPIGPRTVLSIERPRISAANGWVKRGFDITFSVIMLIIVSPVMIITAIAIKFEDGGPIFYKSERIGKKGEPYYVWKFRSMCIDAEEKIQALIQQNGGQSLLFKMKDDPRVTRVGKFIRKYSIDELPQFFNTINGTMSVVGPRPQVQREVDEYDSDMHMRLEVPPGITGLWQVSGRSNLSPQLAQALDLYYVDNWSFCLDIRIIFATLKAVLKPEGAY